MVSPKAYLVISFAAAIIGLFGFFPARIVPSRGWIAVLMLLLVTLALILIDAGDSSSPSRLSMSLVFCLCSPFAVVYSFRARRHAPDKLAGLAAFVGAFIVGIFFLLMLGTAAYYVFEIFTNAA